MYKLIFFSLCIAATRAGFDHGFGFGPIIAAPPILVKAPILVGPATSYATVTKVHVAHPAPIVKAILAPQPIFKSYVGPPLALGHGFH